MDGNFPVKPYSTSYVTVLTYYIEKTANYVQSDYDLPNQTAVRFFENE